MTQWRRWLGAVLLLVGMACTTVQPPRQTGGDPDLPPPVPEPSGVTLEGTTQSHLFVGAGDIAYCLKYTHNLYPAIFTGLLVRQLIAAHPHTVVFTAGDNAYMFGTEVDFKGCYDPAWGFFKERTRPVPGNHDVYLRGGAAYYDYFGANAGPPMRGWYSYDVGDWHIVALNSNVPEDAAQLEWLRNDLAASTKPCLAAIWHHPLFSSGANGQKPKDLGRKTNVFWDVLLAHGADIVVNGHDHHYERFLPQNAAGAPDPDGIVQFVVGTGGADVERPPRPGQAILPNSATHFAEHGILALTLHAGSYEWKFLCAQCTDTPIRDASTEPVQCH